MMNVSFAQSRKGFLDFAEDEQPPRRCMKVTASHDKRVKIPVGLLQVGLIIASLNQRIRSRKAALGSERAKETTDNV